MRDLRAWPMILLRRILRKNAKERKRQGGLLPALPQLGRLGMAVFVIGFCCACGANISPSPSDALPPPTPAPSLTARPTRTAAVSTPTSQPSPTIKAATKTAIVPTREPTATATPPLARSGPWLVLRQIQHYGEGSRKVDLILLNQDGAGRAQIPVEHCSTGLQISTETNPENYLVKLGWETYLVNPNEGKALGIDDRGYPCGEYFNTGEQSGLLAASFTAEETGLPQLGIYALPEGKRINAFPRLGCSLSPESCSADDADQGATAWDPTGRYLAFSVLLDGGASSLYVYDVERDAARKLAGFAESVCNIWWSPDAKRLILGVCPFRVPGFVSTVWTVPLAGGEPRQLYALEYPFLHEVVDWVDNDRFLVCDGSLIFVATEGARNLRLVDSRTGLVKDLFMDIFQVAILDRKSEMVALYTNAYIRPDEDGFYLISLAGSEPHSLERPPEVEQGHLSWRLDAGVFITEAECKEHKGQYWGIDPRDGWHCVELPAPAAPADIWESPDGQWRALARDGLWVERQGSTPVQVYPETPSLVIWQPDSNGLFFAAPAALYHLSVPDFTLTDLGLQPDRDGTGQMPYQWIGGESVQSP